MIEERWAAPNLSVNLTSSAARKSPFVCHHFPTYLSNDIFTYELRALVRNVVHLKSGPEHPKITGVAHFYEATYIQDSCSNGGLGR